MPIFKERPRHDALAKRVDEMYIDLTCEREVNPQDVADLLYSLGMYLSTVKGIFNAVDNLESIIESGMRRVL